MLRVGIHENVVVSKAAINDKGTLEIEFLQAGSTDAAAALAGNTGLTGDETVNIRLFGPSVKYFDKTRTGKDMLIMVVGFKAILTELLSAYIANPVIDATKGIKLENLEVVFTDQSVVDTAYTNIITQFVTQIKPFLNSKASIRVKLPRKSAQSGYAGIPKFGPWVETMDIPKEASKLKWGSWELENGFDTSDVKVDAISDAVSKEQVAELDQIFDEGNTSKEPEIA